MYAKLADFEVTIVAETIEDQGHSQLFIKGGPKPENLDLFIIIHCQVLGALDAL